MVGFEEELQTMGYLKSVPIKSEQTADSLKISSDAEIGIIPVKPLSQENGSQDKCGNGAISLATTLPGNKQPLSTAVSCSGTRPKSDNVPQLPLRRDTTKPSTCVKKSDVTTAVGEPLARGDRLTIQKTEERIRIEASTASVYQMSVGATVVKTIPCHPCNVQRDEVTKTRPTQPKVTSVRCQTSMVSQNNQQSTTEIAGSQCTQDSPSCVVHISNAREQIQPPSMGSDGKPIFSLRFSYKMKNELYQL